MLLGLVVMCVRCWVYVFLVGCLIRSRVHVDISVCRCGFGVRGLSILFSVMSWIVLAVWVMRLILLVISVLVSFVISLF